MHTHAGSLTLLVIRHDERTGRYRSQSGVLEKYSNMNKIPEVCDLAQAPPATSLGPVGTCVCAETAVHQEEAGHRRTLCQAFWR